MSTITIPLSDDRMKRLKEVAQRAGVTPEELARASLEDLLGRPREDFLSACQYVLEKNQELYRRLA